MKSVLDILALTIAKLFVGVLNVLPHRAALIFARGLVSLILLFFPRARSVAMRNLSISFPEMSRAEHRLIYRRSLWVLADNLLGFSRIRTYTKEACAKVARGNDIVDKLREVCARGRGVLVVVGHLGSFERNLQLWVQLIGPCAVLVRGFGLERLDAWWNARREFWGATVFARRGGYAESLSRLAAGETVLMLCDQNVKANYAIFAPFFGISAATTKTPAVAAMRTGCEVIFLSSFSDEQGIYCADFQQLLLPGEEGSSPEERMTALTAQMNACFERVIRKNPEQWFWIHRRWKTRPEGEPENFYDFSGSII